MSEHPQVDTDLVIMSWLLTVRSTRPWIDCEFLLYQKLCRNREAILDHNLVLINASKRKIRRESSHSST